MNLEQLIGTGLAAACGGVAAWVAIRVDVALAKRIAEDAQKDADKAHSRLDDHIEKHHTRGIQ